MDVKDTIGTRIRQVRIAFNMKQKDFAKEFNMFQSNLSEHYIVFPKFLYLK